MRIGITPAPQYEDWIDDYEKARDNKFDEQVHKLLAENWGAGYTDFKVVKRDYNIVYSL